MPEDTAKLLKYLSVIAYRHERLCCVALQADNLLTIGWAVCSLPDCFSRRALLPALMPAWQVLAVPLLERLQLELLTKGLYLAHSCRP
jgi:hypothetical protein